MCNTANRSIVQEVLYELVKEGKMFTAFNVTTEAKKRGASERHRDLKVAVHDMVDWLEDNGYDRTLIDIDGMSAWLFFPENSDPTEFDGKLTQSKAPQTVVQAPTATAPQNATPSGKRLKTTVADKDGRFNVGPDVLKEINAEPGDTVILLANANNVVVVKQNMKSVFLNNLAYLSLKDISLTVQKDGRLRINPTIMKKFGYGGVKRFSVEISGFAVRLKAL